MAFGLQDVESPSVDCPEDITTTTGQVSGGLQVGESTATVNLQYTDAQVIPTPGAPFRPYLTHFSPENSRFLCVFTVSPRRFQQAQNRNPGPRNSVKGAQTPFCRPS